MMVAKIFRNFQPCGEMRANSITKIFVNLITVVVVVVVVVGVVLAVEVVVVCALCKCASVLCGTE